jgi:hypothetical protein
VASERSWCADGAAGGQDAAGDAVADERSEAAVVCVGALGDGTTVPSREEPSPSALAETCPAEHSFPHALRHGVSRIISGIAFFSTTTGTHMKKLSAGLVIVLFASLLSSCDSFSNLLSPARGLSGNWQGNLISSDNTGGEWFTTNSDMTLDLKQNGNAVTGTITLISRSVSKIPTGWPTPTMNQTFTGSLNGTVSGVNFAFTTSMSDGSCLNLKGTFTSDIMDGMKNPANPPMLTCGVVVNAGGGGVKGLEWHLSKK